MKKLSILLLLATLVGFTACKDDEDDMAGTGSLLVEFEHNFGADELELNSPGFYTNATAEQLKFVTLKYYVSNFVLTKSDGSTYTAPDSYYLINMETPASNLITIPNVPAGDYTSLSFMIGVDSTHNVSGAQAGALSTANGMFWDWNSGYIFFKMEGTSPQSGSGSFTYHVGGFSGSENALRTVNINFNGAKAQVRKDQSSQAHISVDVAKAFDATPSLSVATTNAIHMPGASAVEMSGRYQNMFEFEHVHN